MSFLACFNKFNLSDAKGIEQSQLNGQILTLVNDCDLVHRYNCDQV
jgi:hypothetical protein